MNCLWKEFDSWCKCTQCLKHAIALNPEIYSLEEPSPIEGHPCNKCEGCGYQPYLSIADLDKERKDKFVAASEEEVARWKAADKKRTVRAILNNVQDQIERLKELYDVQD